MKANIFNLPFPSPAAVAVGSPGTCRSRFVCINRPNARHAAPTPPSPTSYAESPAESRGEGCGGDPPEVCVWGGGGGQAREAAAGGPGLPGPVAPPVPLLSPHGPVSSSSCAVWNPAATSLARRAGASGRLPTSRCMPGPVTLPVPPGRVRPPHGPAPPTPPGGDRPHSRARGGRGGGGEGGGGGGGRACAAGRGARRAGACYSRWGGGGQR